MDNYKIGSFLFRLREEKHMTQEEVGTYVGVSNKAVSKWETGEGLPNYEAMMALSTLYGVSINEILAGERKEEPVIEEKSPFWKEDGAAAYYSFTIISLLLFINAFLAVLISNLAGSIFIGAFISLVLFAIGATLYGCSFIFKKRNNGLIIANNFLGVLSFGTSLLASSCLGYMSGFNWLTVEFWTMLRILLFMSLPPAIAIWVISAKSLKQGLSLKSAMIKYGHKLTAITMLGIATYYLVYLVAGLTNSFGNSQAFPFSGILVTSFFVGCLAFGLASLKFRLSGVIGSYALIVGSCLYFVASSSTVMDSLGRYFLYDISSVYMFVIASLLAALTTASYIFYKKTLKQ